jgi:ribonuclease HII
MAKPKPYPDLTSEVVLGFSASELLIIGVDEVGRGCLAGPVVAAAAVLPTQVFAELPFHPDGKRKNKRDAKKHLKCDHKKLLWEVCDSKMIVEEERAPIAGAVRSFVRGYAVAEASVEEINELNILYASHLAMQRAVEQLEQQLGRQADVVIVDGHIVPKCFRERGDGRAIPLIKGDQKSFSVACAAILAKTYRDELMASLESRYPGYGMSQHKGYPTPFHKARIQELGATVIHRAHFRGVAAEVEETDESPEDFPNFAEHEKTPA